MTIQRTGDTLAFKPDPDALALGRVFAQTAGFTDVLTIAGATFRVHCPPLSTAVEIVPARPRSEHRLADCGPMAGPDDLERLASVLLGMASVLRDNYATMNAQMEQAERGAQAAERRPSDIHTSFLRQQGVAVGPGAVVASNMAGRQAAYNGEEPRQ